MRTAWTENGASFTRASLDALVVTERVDEPRNRLASFEPSDPYVAIVLEGAVAKTFVRGGLELTPSCAVRMPAAAAHETLFGVQGARVLLIRGDAVPAAAGVSVVRDVCVAALAWRLAAELRATDAVWPLAVEGLALELLAAVARGSATPTEVPAAWLCDARALLHDGATSLGAVAAAVGVHPSHLARAFRAQHGLSVGAYVRRLRLERAAAALATTDAALAEIGATAGFADQAHFTRAFKFATGLTPGRYRALARR